MHAMRYECVQFVAPEKATQVVLRGKGTHLLKNNASLHDNKPSVIVRN